MDIFWLLEAVTTQQSKNPHCRVPAVAQWDQWCFGSAGMQVQFPAQDSGLRIQRWFKCGLGHNGSSDPIPSRELYRPQGSQKKKESPLHPLDGSTHSLLLRGEACLGPRRKILLPRVALSRPHFLVSLCSQHCPVIRLTTPLLLREDLPTAEVQKGGPRGPQVPVLHSLNFQVLLGTFSPCYFNQGGPQHGARDAGIE